MNLQIFFFTIYLGFHAKIVSIYYIIFCFGYTFVFFVNLVLSVGLLVDCQNLQEDIGFSHLSN